MKSINQAYQLFIDEAPELLREIENGLIHIQEERSVNTIHAMMRSAHSIKGGAASVGLRGIQNIAHKLEDYLKALYDESLIIDEDLESLLFEAFDSLAIPIQEQINNGNFDAETSQQRAEIVWEKLESKLGEALKQVGNYMPSSEELGIDIVASMFKVDVEQEIERLRQIADSPTPSASEVLQESFEVLYGLSELVNLSGFSFIITIAQEAFKKHPEEVANIASLLASDLEKSRILVLEGDRTEGGSPSADLLALAEDNENLNTITMTGLEDVFGSLEEIDDIGLEIEPPSFGVREEVIAEEAEYVDTLKNEGEEDTSLLSFDFTDLVSEINDGFEENFNNENIFDISSGELENWTSSEEFRDNPEEALPDLGYLMEDMDNVNYGREMDLPQNELQAQSYQFFMEEAVELIALIDDNLDSVLETRNINEVNEVARAAHSLKGGSRSAGLEDIGMIALRVEKSLKALFNENIPLDDDMRNYLREIYQYLRQAIVGRMENQNFDEKSALTIVNSKWEKFEQQYGEEIAKSEEYLPSSSDLGIDIATSIFEVDVPEGIANIQQALDSGDETEIKQILELQAEVFTGFGEMLALPGFCSICETAISALDHNPSQIKAIAQAFLDSLQQAQIQVMEGDRTLGGEANTELLKLSGKVPQEKTTETPVDTSDNAYGFFVEEAPELLQILENGLLNLRTERDIAKIHELMRAAHSIKGGAASVGLEAIKTIAHQLEDVFKVFYNPEVEIDTDLESWLLEAFDCLRNALTTQIETGSYQPEVALEEANLIRAKIHSRLGAMLDRTDDFIPSSTDLGVDIVQSMFEVDVEEEIQRLKNVIENPQSQPLAGELRATLEVFSGFGEMLQLPGFAEIAKLGLKALEENPPQVLDIIHLVINDAEKARTLVLEGDRTTGGQPSQELRQLAEGISFNLEDIEEEIFFLDGEEETEEIQPSLTEVFGNDIPTTDDIFLTGGDKDTQANISALEDIFQVDVNMNQWNDLDDKEDNIQDIGEIFTSEISETEINLLSKASELALNDDKNSTIPSLDEVFSTEEIVSIASEEVEGNPALEDIFGSESFPVAEDIDTSKNDTTPSLEDVFNLSQEIEPAEEIPSLPLSLDKESSPSENPQDLLTLIEIESLSKQTENGKSITQAESGEEDKILEEVQAPEDLNEALKSIIDVYDKLPGLQDAETIKNNIKQRKPITENPTPTKVQTPSVKNNLTIRVDLDRLERMNNLMGELSINRNGLSLQNNKLQNSVRELVERFSFFQQMANNLRDLSDKMLVSPEKFSPRNGHNEIVDRVSLSEEEDFNLTSAFDALEMDRYDNLYNITQALIEQMIQLEEAVEDITLYASQSGQTVENQRQMLNRLRDELMWARMLPLGEILNRFPRVLRDLSVKFNKKVNLKLSGTNVLVDKAALEKLYDPLVHLIRNAFDHGIETPELRKQRGKPETGMIEVKAYHQGNQTVIEIRDDGGGLNLNKIGQKALEKQLLSPEQLAVITKDNLLDLIFEPGFSTASAVTEISGRGVGLDIVRSQLRSLKGTIGVDSEPGVGTTFILRLPLTLTIDKLLVLSAGIHFYALPSDNIVEIIVPEDEQLKTSGNQRFLYFENKVVPIYPILDILSYNCYLSDESMVNSSLEILPTPEEWAKPLLLINLGAELFALEVDNLVSEQELVIKPFNVALTAPSYTYGCTVLGDGTLIPVINTSILLGNFLQNNHGGGSLSIKPSLTRTISGSGASGNTQSFRVSSVLVVDDSAAMRRTLALSLEKAGYRVIQAKDGKDALEQLQQGIKVNLVICDIEMPNMNGFEFLGQRRRFSELNQIPVAMLTSRSNDKHRKLATHLGANAYFTKPYIEQKFLESIKTLMDSTFDREKVGLMN